MVGALKPKPYFSHTVEALVKKKQKKFMFNDIDTAKLYVQFFRPLAQCAVSLMLI